MKRPQLETTLDIETFLQHYYLKEELIDFCRTVNLQATGSKEALTNRIIHYLRTGKRKFDAVESSTTQKKTSIHLSDLIEENFKCTEIHRAFYKEHINSSFHFNVDFQKWLKNHPGQTYHDSILAYQRILADKRQKKTTIGKQFKYNTYIRDFFEENPNKSLSEAIKCWHYKKTLPGNHCYETKDLQIL